MIKFDTIEYLKIGTSKQINVYRVLTENKIIERLFKFSPILTGTVPIEIDTDDSDLDIACFWTDKYNFIKTISTFSNNPDFSIIEKNIKGLDSVIGRFKIEGFKIEIFGQNKPTKEQDSFRHMIIEYQIIQKMGDEFRMKIIDLKKSGLKTEPAFGLLLGIENDSYNQLLKYEIPD